MEPTETAKLRDDVIESYDVVGGPAARELEALAELAAQVADGSGAAVILGTGHPEHRIGSAAADAESRDSAHVVPLVSGSGLFLGRLEVGTAAPHGLSARQRSGLETIARQVVGVLELCRRTRQLEVATAELASSRDQLTLAREELSCVARQVSHDLRTPLTAILANAEMLAGEPVSHSPDVAWMIDGISRAANRLNTMIEQLLDHAVRGGDPRAADDSRDQREA